MNQDVPKEREFLLNEQSPLPEVNLSNLTVVQRKLFDNLTRVVVGATLAWASTVEIMAEVDRFRRRPNVQRAIRRHRD